LRASIRNFQPVIIKLQIQRLRLQPSRLLGSAGNHRFAGELDFDVTLCVAGEAICARAASPQPAEPSGREITRRQTWVGSGALPVEGNDFVGSRYRFRTNGVGGDESRFVGRILIGLLGRCGNPQGKKGGQCGYACITQKNAPENALDAKCFAALTCGNISAKAVMHFMQNMHGVASE
jgi:hypothetical protein